MKSSGAPNSTEVPHGALAAGVYTQVVIIMQVSQSNISTAVMSQTRSRSVNSLGQRESSGIAHHRSNSRCYLCQNNHSHVSSPSEWKSKAVQQYTQSLKVPQNALVCRPCRDDVTLAACNSSYTPMWEQGGKMCV